MFLSRVDERIAKILIERLAHPVPAEELISRVWAENGANETLRVHVTGLRHRLAPLALVITNIRGRGYVLAEAEGGKRSPTPTPVTGDNTRLTRSSPKTVAASRP